jgi:hypothetical protein
MSQFSVPSGRFSAVPRNDDEAAAKKRKELRDKLIRGDEVVVTQDGQVNEKGKQDPNKTAIVVPEGKLAASFFWYERDPKLLASEVEAMNKFFPNFKLEKLEDGRLCWVGKMTPNNVRENAVWHLQAIYDHNHPDNTNWGGSIKIYSIEPDLEELNAKVGPIPHLLRDSMRHIYLCTARKEDVKVGDVWTSAASSLSWAAKWITAFELWLAGDIKTAEFGGHGII